MSDTASSLDLDAIESRLKDITPGPWILAHDDMYVGGPVINGDWDWISMEFNGGNPNEEGHTDEDYRGPKTRVQANMRFVAHAREDIPALIAEIRRLRAQGDTCSPAPGLALEALVDRLGWTAFQAGCYHDSLPVNPEADYQIARTSLLAALAAPAQAPAAGLRELELSRDNWMEQARQFCSNAAYYMGLLDECAKYLGEAAYTSDDGSRQDSPVRAKIPELVAGLQADVAGTKQVLADLAEFGRPMPWDGPMPPLAEDVFDTLASLFIRLDGSAAPAALAPDSPALVEMMSHMSSVPPRESLSAQPGSASTGRDTYFLCAMPPPGVKSDWICDYCGEHRSKHAADMKCPGAASTGEVSDAG